MLDVKEVTTTAAAVATTITTVTQFVKHSN